MRGVRFRNFIIAGILLSTVMCRKPYEPPAIKEVNHFLAVDGFINTGPFSVTKIIVGRSLNLMDSVTNLPELNAQVSIQSADGASYPLFDTGYNGIYVSAQLNLDPGQKYQLSVITSEGLKYLSDPVTPKTAPPVDSLTWDITENPAAATELLNIYANAHDPTNNTRYYRWDYIETWQHQSVMQTYWGLKDGLEYPISPEESTYNCWTTGNSNTIMLASSITLASDVISRAPLTSFSKNDPKMDIKYSMLLRQYPLDLEAYKYWLTVQKNSQSLGGLFDIQPSQINGNFHCISVASNTALGYISACSVKEFRFFIDNFSLPGWKSNPAYECPIKDIPSDPTNFARWYYSDPAYQLWYYVSNFPSTPIMKITYKDCLDCRLQGGTNIKPPFWQ